ncbi:uncharacterized protein O3C94_018993 [Discoglossus pictus]
MENYYSGCPSITKEFDVSDWLLWLWRSKIVRTIAVLDVTAPPYKNALIGSRGVLPCTFHVDNPPVNPQFLAVFWHFGNKELLRYDNKGTVLSPGVSVDEKAAMNGDVSLTIHNVTLSDEGTYTCLVIYSRDKLQKAIKLNLLARPVAIIKAICADNTVLLCSVTGFYPANIKVNWFNKGQIVGKPDLGTTQRNSDGTFRVTSTVSLTPLETKNSPVIVCQVEHESLQDPVEEHFRDVYEDNSPNVPAAVILTMVITAALILAIFWFLFFKTKFFQRFRVSNILRPELWKDDDKITLSCSASDCVKDVQVTWTVTESDGNKVTVSDWKSSKEEESGQLLISDYTMRADRSMSEGLHNVISTLSFIPSASKHKNMKIVCKFNCDGKSKEKRLHWVDHCKKPEISEPIRLTLCDTGEVLCSVTLQRFYPISIRIRWTCGAGSYKDLETVSEPFTYNNDQTCNVQSVCGIPGHMFNEPGFKVRVTWSHGSMDNPEHRELYIRDTDFVWRPVIDEITKLPHIVNRTETKLQCNISGYFPDSLDVKWLKREAGNQALFPVSPSEKYKIPVMDVRREADNTFTCTASLFVFVSAQSEGGAEFICQVAHPSLERPLMKSTGPLTVKEQKN